MWQALIDYLYLLRTHLHQASVSKLWQLCDDASDSIHIKNNGVAPEWGCNLFSSDSTDLNENKIASIIAKLSQPWRWRLVQMGPYLVNHWCPGLRIRTWTNPTWKWNMNTTCVIQRCEFCIHAVRMSCYDGILQHTVTVRDACLLSNVEVCVCFEIV